MVKHLMWGRVGAAALAAALVWGGAGHAQQSVYFGCVFPSQTWNSWIKPEMGFEMEPSGDVYVADRIVWRFLGGPAKTRRRDKAEVLTLSWKVRIEDGAKNRGLFRYQARLDTGSGDISVRVRPNDSPQSWRANGTCQTSSEPPRSFTYP